VVNLYSRPASFCFDRWFANFNIGALCKHAPAGRLDVWRMLAAVFRPSSVACLAHAGGRLARMLAAV
jgi:hypothetical protein